MTLETSFLVASLITFHHYTITFPPTTVGVYKLVVSSPSGAKVDKQLELTVYGDGETVDAEDVSTDFSPIPVAQFGAFVTDYHANSNKKFRDHYKVCIHIRVIPQCAHTHTHTHPHTHTHRL